MWLTDWHPWMLSTRCYVSGALHPSDIVSIDALALSCLPTRQTASTELPSEPKTGRSDYYIFPCPTWSDMAWRKKDKDKKPIKKKWQIEEGVPHPRSSPPLSVQAHVLSVGPLSPRSEQLTRACATDPEGIQWAPPPSLMLVGGVRAC